MRYYDPHHNRLIYCEQAASPEFWDRHWQAEDFSKAIHSHNRFVVRWTARYLPKGSRILEGGCGRGNNVYSLQQQGYDAYGVDFAEKTVALICEHAPDLKVILGDVRSLPFPDNFFEGYWSLGVIEHFYEGYSQIISEMSRVLRRGGCLFLTFPQMSMLRRVKVRLGMYPAFPSSDPALMPDDFYQFALDANAVGRDLQRHGFELVKKSTYAGFKGFKDEAGPIKPLLQRLYDGSGIIPRVTQRLAEPLLRSWCGHSALLIFRQT